MSQGTVAFTIFQNQTAVTSRVWCKNQSSDIFHAISLTLLHIFVKYLKSNIALWKTFFFYYYIKMFWVCYLTEEELAEYQNIVTTSWPAKMAD